MVYGIDKMLDVSNTVSRDSYHAYCRSNGLGRRPARFPREVPEFFIKLLTEPEDLSA
jgi:DNA modification methylase